MRHPWLRRSMLHSMRLGCALAILLLSAVSALLVAAPVLAAGDTVALSLTNGSTFTYGGTAPKFTAVVTLGAAPTTSPTWQVKVTIAGGATFSNSSPPTKSSDGLTLTFTGLQPASPVPAGAHTATAEFTNPETSATVTSDPVSFTVNKAALNMACAIAMNGQNVIGVGKPITVQMTTASGKGSLPTEARTGGTFTVKLDGPTHTTSANLTANSVFAVTATAPAQNGIYTLTCIFNGNANYASASFTSNNPYTISSLHALGTVQLYSNPTTLTAGQKIDYYVVFHPASGLPTPSGQFTLSFGSHHTDAFTLGSAGTFLIYFGTISSLAGVTDIQVFYMGDVNYDQATVHFPLTNPAIPSGIDDGTSGNPQATTTTTTPTTAAETPGAETTPTAVSAAGALTAPPAGNGDNLGLILIVAAVIMLLIAGLGTGVGIIIYRMRQSGDHDDDAQGSYGYPAGYGQVGQIGRLGAYDDSGQYRPSGQYRNAGQYGRSGVYRQNGQANQAGQMGQMGQSGLTGQTGRYRRPGQFGQSGQYRQPGQAGQAGQTSKHRQPGQYGPRGPFPDEETARFPRRDQ